MEAYKRWVRGNKDYVHSLESITNGLTWLLPERFSDSEIGPEAVTSILGIISAINDHIINTTPSQVHPRSAEQASFPYSLCITLLKDLETLVEVVAQQYYGVDKKWNFIAATEAIKLLVRVATFHNTGYKILLNGGETMNVMKDSDVLNTQHGYEQYPGPGKFMNSNGHHPWNSGGRALSALYRFGENARTLHPVHHQHAIMEPPTPTVERPTLSSILSEKGLTGGLFLMGEMLFITRPLIYVSLIRKYGVRSWLPWFISLGFDLTSMGILSHITESRGSGIVEKFQISDVEQEELKRRKLLWALYLMRDPFFSKYTRQKLESTEKLLEPLPIVGLLTAKLVELLTGAQTLYTYMSGS